MYMREVNSVQLNGFCWSDNAVIDIRLMNYCSGMKINTANVESLNSQKNMKEDVMLRVT